MLGYNVSVPPYVRQALLSRSINNDDILPAIVKPSVVDQHKASIAHAEIQMMQNAGHDAAFWDDAARFNRLQREFAARLG